MKISKKSAAILAVVLVITSGFFAYALRIAESNKGSVNAGAVASFAEGVSILYGK